MRLAACIGVMFVCAAMLGGSANSARDDGGAAWTVKPVSDTQKWLRVDVEGDTLYGFRLQGTDFTVTGVKSVRATGGDATQCSVTGSPATLACDGDLTNGISVFVQLTTSGAGGAYQFAFLFVPHDQNLIYIPSNQTSPPEPLGGSLGFTSPSAARVTIRNPGTASFQQLEVAPVGFRATGVSTTDCGVTDGGGIACQHPLGPGGTAVIRFTAQATNGASAYLLAEGSTTGVAYVQAGDPCPDLDAGAARIKSEAAVLKTHLAKMSRVRSAKPRLGPLRRKLAAVTKQLSAAERAAQQCASGQARKKATSASCDSQTLAASRAGGTVAGLMAVLPTERRVAAKVKSLRGLARTTQKQLVAARAASMRAAQRLLDCDASLAQD